jgi:S1-C subfamily serine protease
MLQPSFSTSRQQLIRVVASGLLTMQAAIATTVVSEFVMTTPTTPFASTALAQSNSRNAAEDNPEAAVVYIETNRGSGSGSGVIVDPSGLIVTNAHVVEGARTVEVNIQGRMLQAEVVAMGDSKCLDLALLHVPGQHNLPTLDFADGSSIHKTQQILAIGYPLGIAPNSATVVQGTVSNTHSELDMIQFTGPINPGNSGGAIVDSHSRLVGIVTGRVIDDRNSIRDINFAISVEKVQAFLEAFKQSMKFPMGQYVIPANQSTDVLMQTVSLDGSVASGTLQQGDSLLCEGGSLSDLYSFEAEAGQAVLIDMVGQQIGSYLLLIGPDGREIARSDVSDRNESAFVLKKLPQTGTYTVIANAAVPGQVGNYQLQITTPILVEGGALDRSAAPCLDNVSRCRDYQFRGEAGQTVTVLLHGAEFDPYLLLLNPNGEVVKRGETPRQGIFSVELPQEGWYTLVVSSVDPQATGNFFVSIHNAADFSPATEVSQRQGD